MSKAPHVGICRPIVKPQMLKSTRKHPFLSFRFFPLSRFQEMVQVESSYCLYTWIDRLPHQFKGGQSGRSSSSASQSTSWEINSSRIPTSTSLLCISALEENHIEEMVASYFTAALAVDVLCLKRAKSFWYGSMPALNPLLQVTSCRKVCCHGTVCCRQYSIVFFCAYRQPQYGPQKTGTCLKLSTVCKS